MVICLVFWFGSVHVLASLILFNNPSFSSRLSSIGSRLQKPKLFYCDSYHSNLALLWVQLAHRLLTHMTLTVTIKIHGSTACFLDDFSLLWSAQKCSPETCGGSCLWLLCPSNNLICKGFKKLPLSEKKNVKNSNVMIINHNKIVPEVKQINL